MLCGGISLLIKLLCGWWISLFIFIVAAILTLLAAMQITIPSIIRAIANRPRPDWDEDEDDFIPELKDEFYTADDSEIEAEGFTIEDVPEDEFGADFGADYEEEDM